MCNSWPAHCKPDHTRAKAQCSQPLQPFLIHPTPYSKQEALTARVLAEDALKLGVHLLGLHQEGQEAGALGDPLRSTRHAAQVSRRAGAGQALPPTEACSPAGRRYEAAAAAAEPMATASESRLIIDQTKGMRRLGPKGPLLLLPHLLEGALGRLLPALLGLVPGVQLHRVRAQLAHKAYGPGKAGVGQGSAAARSARRAPPARGGWPLTVIGGLSGRRVLRRGCLLAGSRRGPHQARPPAQAGCPPGPRLASSHARSGHLAGAAGPELQRLHGCC